MEKRFILTALCASILLSSACGSEPIGTTQTSASDTTSAQVEEKKPPFESCDYGGEEFHVLAPEWGVYLKYHFAEEQNGETLNDTIYERNAMVEEYLGVTMTHTRSGTINDIPTAVEKSVMAGDNAYQLALTHCITGIRTMAVGDLLYDWNELEYVNLDAEYWNQSCNENIAIGGKQYYAVSDYMLPAPYLYVFNKDMITDYKLDNPYELVRNGTWTLDKMAQMAAEVTRDLDGSSTFDEKDQYGLVNCSDTSRWISFMYSADVYSAKKSADGKLEVTINTPNMLTLVEKLDTLINKSGNVHIDNLNAEGLCMSTGRVLFELLSSYDLGRFRDTTVDFGILPYPKLHEEQERYITNDWAGMMCVPKTVASPEMVGKVTELLAYYSADTTVDVYRNIVLGEKLSRDADSKEMLDIIFDNIVYDPGQNFFGFSAGLGQLFYTIPNMIVTGKSGDFASWYATYSSVAEGEIEVFLNEIADNQ